MANYSIVINSRFKPFSYAEMLAPVQQSTEAHQQVEDAYASLATQAELVAGKANEQTDPIAYARYKSYADDLMAQADRLARYGLTPDDRRSMLGLRARYAKDIIPIQEAIETRKKQAEMQQQAYLQNPTLLLSRRASTTSLDEYLKNPNLEYDSYSGAMLTQQVSQQAQALAKELTAYGLGKPIDAYTNTFLKRNGFTSAQVLEAITNPDDPKSSPVLKAIVDQTLASSGVTKWGDEATIARARAYANQGLFSAVGTSDVAPMENWKARRDAEFAQSVALENLKHQHALAQQSHAARLQAAAQQQQQLQQQAAIRAWDPNRVDLYAKNSESDTMDFLLSPKGKKAFIEDHKNHINANVIKDHNTFVRLGLMTKDGYLTNKGLKVWTTDVNSFTSGNRYNGSGSIHDASSYGPTKPGQITREQAKLFHDTLRYILPGNKTTGIRVNDINKAYTSYITGGFAEADAIKTYNKVIAPSQSNPSSKSNMVGTSVMRVNVQGQGLENAVRTAIGDSGKITAIGEFDQSNKSIGRGKTMSRKDFDKAIKDGAYIQYIGNNPYTNQLFFQMSDGKWYHMPQDVYSQTAINTISQNNKLLNSTGLSDYEEMVYGNNIMTQITQPLNSYKGTDIKLNDGTVTVPVEIPQ